MAPIGGVRSGIMSAARDATPDSEDLYARYSAKDLSLNDGESVSTWADATGNDHDLTDDGSPPTYVADGFNGNPVVRFDGSDEFLNVAFDETLSQPTHMFIVSKLRTNEDEFNEFLTGDDTTNRQSIAADNNNNGNNWTLFAGDRLNSDVGVDTDDTHIFSGLFDGGNSTLRLDGSQIASGDAGSNDLDGLTVGSHPTQSTHSDIDVAEIILYPMDKTGIENDVESYLSNKWGVSI